MKNILIPIDFSDNSWNALQYALRYFDGVPCAFYLTHISLPCPLPACLDDDIPPKITTLKLGVSKEMDLLVQRAEKFSKSPEHYFFPLHDHRFFSEAIKRKIKEKSIDFIVMGAKGATDDKVIALGENAGEVLTKVYCPALLIPPNAYYQKPETIVFATDYNLKYSAKVLQTLEQHLNFHNAKLNILHIQMMKKPLTQEQLVNKTRLDEYFSDVPHSFFEIKHKDIGTGLHHFLKKRKIDLVAIAAKNLNFFQQIFSEPIQRKNDYRNSIPSLLLHEQFFGAEKL